MQDSQKKQPNPLTWDMDSVFPGGSDSKEYAVFREAVKKDLKVLTDKFGRMPQKLNDSSRPKWADYLVKLQELLERLGEANAFAHCLISQNVADEKAHRIVGEMDTCHSNFEKLIVLLEAFSKKQSGKEWDKLVNSKKLRDVTFMLQELRRIAKLKMAPEFESFATELAVNGYHAWNRLYDKIYGDLRADYEEDGQIKKLSMGQLSSKMDTADRNARRQAFQKLEKAWDSTANATAMALNFQAGFRLTLYEKRKWDSPLFEPLLNSRIKEETLMAMWSAVSKAAPRINEYVSTKKKILGIDKFCWYDQTAPVGKSSQSFTYENAGKLILENLRTFSPEMADFSKKALEKRWVEAEDRPGKAGGGYCTTLHVKKESRIFMTWGGTYSDLGTLAHELGHAYHHDVLINLPIFATICPMTLAETASTFNEFLVTDAALSKATDPQEKLMLLDQKLQNAYIMMCNIYARFLFDQAFYTERKKGLLSRSRLDELMLEAQKKAFVGSLDPDEGYHPLFWASKLHFYLTDRPYYHFPYTFGYLFASGVYNRARTEGQAFAKNYRALLADSGKMTTEEVAEKHLGVDLTGEAFWKEAVDRVLSDIAPFVELANKV